MTHLSIHIKTSSVFSVVPVKFTAITRLDMKRSVVIWYLFVLKKIKVDEELERKEILNNSVLKSDQK